MPSFMELPWLEGIGAEQVPAPHHSAGILTVVHYGRHAV